MNSENIKSISSHIPIHSRPINDIDFGYYLAGLIDGNGYIDINGYIKIVFSTLDVSLAYYIKGKIGFGNVSKIKNKNAFLLLIGKKQGIEKVISLINGKIRTDSKYNQLVNLLNNEKYIYLKEIIEPVICLDDNLLNYWLTGFSDADASFQIKIQYRPNRVEVKMNFQIDQKNKDLLIKIKNFFGGNIVYSTKTNTYYYDSTSFGSAKKVIDYFDQYSLVSSKYINYMKWRKVYTLIQNKEHLTKKGRNKIIKLKNTINNVNVYSMDLS